MKKLLTLLLLATLTLSVFAEDGSRLWLRFNSGINATVTTTSRTSPTLNLAMRELQAAWKGEPITLTLHKDRTLAPEGFRIVPAADGSVTLTSPTDRGLLYGSYHLLRLQQTKTELFEPIVENPAYDLRILNHWDNPDGTIERGYAGSSLWDWDKLPATLSPRYEAYARANASIGINATVLNNVNASPKMLSTPYLQKVRALADLFRPYGIRVFLSVNFASPMALDGLPTADPSDKAVIRWWKQKINEIYRLIPDFGGFLVKANSEGQPGPCDYSRTHAEGANMLADALKPHRGIVMWRAFVYAPNDPDRAKQAYQEFVPLDGRFRSNVIIQTKNGPVDFQPREPYSPLFTALAQTRQMAEFQITQEYLGHSNHAAFLAPMWREFFDFVAPDKLDAIAGVANIGNDANWCGHPLAQANWYAFGRLAWNPRLTSNQIATEWIRQSLLSPETKEAEAVRAESCIRSLLLESREAVVNYMMPIGLHHIFAWDHHYGPGPWLTAPNLRADWTPVYYHKADTACIGFNRTHTAPNATAQYPDSLRRLYDDLHTCPDEYLLWFHHAPWNHRMHSGRTVWNELCHRYTLGVSQARRLQTLWDQARPALDADIFSEVQRRLCIQVRDAVWWKDACLLYFQNYSRQPFPADMERPIHTSEQVHKDRMIFIDNYTCPSAEELNRVR